MRAVFAGACKHHGREDDNIGGGVLRLSRPSGDVTRHLRGNWLAYWEHEIGRPEDTAFNLKQIRLQSFSGHSGSVKSLAVLDNENSFLSSGRDKTVRLWSLRYFLNTFSIFSTSLSHVIRNMGDGTAVGAAQSVYSGHRKSVFSVSYLATSGLAASCDGVVQLWDPFINNLVHEVEAGRTGSFCVMKGMPSPTQAVVAATTDGTVRVTDTRTGSAGVELKVCRTKQSNLHNLGPN